MGEPSLLTEEQYFSCWEQLTTKGRPYHELKECITGILCVLCIDIVIAANTYATGHSRSGAKLLIVFCVLFALCLLAGIIANMRSHRLFHIWTIYHPYDPEKEYSAEYFKQTGAHFTS